MDRRRWLLVVLAVVALTMVIDVSRNGAGFMNALGEGLTLDVQPQLPAAQVDLLHEFDIDDVEQLYVHARGGRVMVTGADTDVVTAQARVVVYANSTEIAEAYTETLGIGGTVKDGVLQPAVQDAKTRGVSRTTVYWTITVPRQLAVHIEGSFAAVGVNDVDSVVTVGGSAGVSAARVGGLQGVLRGGALEAVDVAGDVSMKVSLGAVTLNRVEGNVHLSGDNGAMQVAGVGGDVTIGPSSAAGVWVGDVRGSLTVEQAFGSLVAIDIDGPVTATVSSGDATITPRTAAPIRVRGDKSSVTLRMTAALWPQYTLSTDGSLRPSQRYEDFIAAFGQPAGPHSVDVKAESIRLDVVERATDATESFPWPDEMGSFGWEFELNVGP